MVPLPRFAREESARWAAFILTHGAHATPEEGVEWVRDLVRRLNIRARDVPVLLGMLRQILWKIR